MQVTSNNIKKALSLTAICCGAALISQYASAREYPVGGPVHKDGMEIASSYLLNIKTQPSPTSMVMGKDVVHLESDVHATQDNKWGFPNGAWIPYVSVDYVVTKVGDTHFMKFGQMLPMTAADGPHYAHSVKLAGKGTYVVHLKYTAPDEKGFLRHIDKATGVPAWFKPFELTFKFKYPQA
ncbi:iron transporter [Marinomonas spartinae]|uniref:iron transporter n=1 Tax=Marinomonas spartinae TaxID=1792290 RepID=UPI0018F1B87A|nr:iron transporter [Marinomonas spartinae]MBJ7554657.1 iron transporter [Marinomonas spartinae]